MFQVVSFKDLWKADKCPFIGCLQLTCVQRAGWLFSDQLYHNGVVGGPLIDVIHSQFSLPMLYGFQYRMLCPLFNCSCVGWLWDQFLSIFMYMYLFIIARYSGRVAITQIICRDNIEIYHSKLNQLHLAAQMSFEILFDYFVKAFSFLHFRSYEQV